MNSVVQDSVLSSLVIESGELRYFVDPVLASRVTRMSYQGVDLLVSSAVHPDNWGATYWTSPQADWGWPPVPEVDSKPYTASAVEGGFELCSPLAQIGDKKFVVKKRFVKGSLQGSIDTCYSIENRGESSFKMANWEIARVGGGGLTFFPTGDAELTPIEPHHPMVTRKQGGVTFYEHADFVPGKSLKLHADGKEGFLAHLSGRHLILKVFRDSLPAEQAPGEGECEIFANFDGKYVEIEVQGPYVAIAPGLSNDFWVKTFVAPLPEGLKRTDYEGLVAFAREQVRICTTSGAGDSFGASD